MSHDHRQGGPTAPPTLRRISGNSRSLPGHPQGAPRPTPACQEHRHAVHRLGIAAVIPAVLLACAILVAPFTALGQFAVSGRIVGSGSTVSSGGGFSVGGAARLPEMTQLNGIEFGIRGAVVPRMTSASDFDPQPDPPKPDHWWSADDRARDLMGRVDGKEIGGLAHVPGLVGPAFQFNGKDAAIQFGPQVGNFGTNDFSVEFLVRSVTKARAAFLLKRPECNWGNFIEMDDNTATLVESVSQQHLVQIPYDRSLNDGDWHHLALTRAGSVVACYIDGTPIYHQAHPFITSLSNNVDLVAGISPCPSHTGYLPLSGLMDEIKIYERRALTPGQVAAAARVVKTLRITQQPQSVTFPKPAASHTLRVRAQSSARAPLYGTLTYQWYFDGLPIVGATEAAHTIQPVNSHSMGRYQVAVNDGVTTVFSDPVDLVVQSFDLPQPAHWWPLDGHLSDVMTGETGVASNGTFYATGRIGAAFHFRGPNYLDLGTRAGNLGTNDFTVTLWMRVSNTVVSPTFLSWRTNCGAGAFWEVGLYAPFLGMAAPRMYFNGARGGGVEIIPTSQAHTNNVRDGRWHHLAYVRHGAVTRLYRDGSLVAANATEPIANLPSEGRLLAGVNPCNLVPSDPANPVNQRNPLFGLLDDIRIYSSALVGPEIVAEMRQAPAAIANPLITTQIALDTDASPTRFKWLFEPGPDRPLEASDTEGVDLETSPDLRIWTVVPNAVRLVNGRIEIVDIEAFAKRESFYRVVHRDPATRQTLGGEVPMANLPSAVVDTAQKHLLAFVSSGDAFDPDIAQWTGVVFAPTARYLFDPGYKAGAEPACVELKLVSRTTNQDRGYILLSISDDVPTVLEFAVEGSTKTDRALAEIPGILPAKFMRFGPTFIAMEDANGNLLGTWGSLPMSPDEAAPANPRRFTGEYLSETGVRTPLEANSHGSIAQVENYAELRSKTAFNPTRALARLARTTSALDRVNRFQPTRTTLRLRIGESLDTATDLPFTRARVDVDDEEPAVTVRLLPRGLKISATRPGTELIRAQTAAGAIITFPVVVGSSASLAGLQPHADCPPTLVKYWGAGTGWAGDQRLFRQLRSPDWCPAVGCGPTALMMLFGWWDANGVPSAFYQLRSGIGQPDHDFRFSFPALATSDAPKTLPLGEVTTDDGIPRYVPTPEEVVARPVASDFYELCNTFCVSGQGATFPGDLVDAARTYVDRVARDLDSPQNEYGEKLLGAEIQHSYTDWYWAGGTDWEGGGLLVANGIKEGRPGIVGLGDTLFDLHYAVAYAYKRVDYFEGCGNDRELVDRRRWFKCNMGWGSKHDPEYHDAESVWFGLTMKLWQKQLPHPN